MLVQISRECTPPYLFTGISNLLQPAQAEVVLGQLSTHIASWVLPLSIGDMQNGISALRFKIIFYMTHMDN
jgi:hypothetical protein